MSKTACIVVAAGRGLRMGGKAPKQFRRLDGIPLVSYSLKVLQGVHEIGSIVLVVPAKAVDRSARYFLKRGRFPKILAVVAGGKLRQDSVDIGLAALPEGIKTVLVHDGVRPFISKALVKGLIQALRRHSAVVPACPIADTLKRLSPDGGRVLSTVSRNGLCGVQTPQGFHLSVLQRAIKKAKSGRWRVTDEAMLVEKMGSRVAVIPGDPANLKITRPSDWEFARRWVQVRRLP